MSEVDATNAGRAQEAYRADSSPFVPAPERPLVQRLVPVERDLRRLSGGNVRRDALAGVTVAALAVPSAMAYAELAGLSLVNGRMRCCYRRSRTQSKPALARRRAMATREDGIASADGRRRSWAVRLFPVLGWLPDYRRGWFRHDAVAALTVWALVVPEAMAYAVIAGVPVQYGLYAMPLALLGYVVFGGSRKLFVGPSASVATISAVTVGSVVAASAAPSEFIALTAALAVTVGVIYVALGVARMGFVARFFAKPVLDGFIIGLGLYIAICQLPKLVGIEKPSGDTVRVLVETIAHIGSWQWATVAVGAAGLAALFAMSRFVPKVPGAVIVVIVSILAADALDLAGHGVQLVGRGPDGLQVRLMVKRGRREARRHAAGRVRDRDRGTRGIGGRSPRRTRPGAMSVWTPTRS